MAKKKIRTRTRFIRRVASRAKKMTLPLAVVAGIVPGIAAVGTTATSAGWMPAAKVAGMIYTGWDYTSGKWSIRNMQLGLMPLAIGVIIHKVAGMLGINRAIAATGIPVIRI